MQDKRITVLLVDDEESLLNAVQRRLKLRGFEVIAVNSGEKALRTARENTVDIAVVDLKMPEMNGKEVMLALKTEHPDMRFVMLTGHGCVGQDDPEIIDNVHACLSKPCDIDTLQQVIVDACRDKINRASVQDS